MAIRRAQLAALAFIISVTRCAAASMKRYRACEEGGFCSVGRTRHFVGDIKESASLKRMLEAISYKNELMVTVFDHDTPSVDVWEDLVRGRARDIPARRAPLRVQEALTLCPRHINVMVIAAVPAAPGALGARLRAPRGHRPQPGGMRQGEQEPERHHALPGACAEPGVTCLPTPLNRRSPGQT